MSNKNRNNNDYFICPSCGAQVPVNAEFCRECGASDELGWDEDGHSWDDELPTGYGPDNDFDYHDFVTREFPNHASPWAKARVKRLAMGILVVIVCLALLVWTLLRY
jgi:ribosomal protein L40E